jgi:site-specific DNA-methyltransferase (adenine-specific)
MAQPSELPLDQILAGDALTILPQLPSGSVDLIFADPPYNLQLSGELFRPNMTRVQGVEEEWDRFRSFEDYDAFSRSWLTQAQRLLKDSGSLWVIGTYHNIFRLGTILQDLGFWILNDIIWIKSNPMPNFRGVRFTNAHETLIWAARSRQSRYTFHHHALKALNDDLQMRSDWTLPTCTGRERLRYQGEKAHPTQKPEALLYRVLMASTNPGDVILDPFFGTGTTGVVARQLGRHWIGVERESAYVTLATQRLAQTESRQPEDPALRSERGRRGEPRVPVGRLLEAGLLAPGQMLYFERERALAAMLRADGHLQRGTESGSIHQLGRWLAGGSPCNGWEHWFFERPDGTLGPLDELREELRRRDSDPQD